MLGRDPQLASSSPQPGAEPFHHTQYYLGPPTPTPPGIQRDPPLWPQANRKVVPLIGTLLKEAADDRAHFSDRETEPEQPSSTSGHALLRAGKRRQGNLGILGNWRS